MRNSEFSGVKKILNFDQTLLAMVYFNPPQRICSSYESL